MFAEYYLRNGQGHIEFPDDTSLRQDLFIAPQERSILLFAFGVAHATQFLINVPVARRGGRIGESYWDVLKGPMLFIFIVDAAMTLLCFSCAVLFLV